MAKTIAPTPPKNEVEADFGIGDAEHRAPEAVTRNGMTAIRKTIFHFGVRLVPDSPPWKTDQQPDSEQDYNNKDVGHECLQGLVGRAGPFKRQNVGDGPRGRR